MSLRHASNQDTAKLLSADTKNQWKLVVLPSPNNTKINLIGIISLSGCLNIKFRINKILFSIVCCAHTGIKNLLCGKRKELFEQLQKKTHSQRNSVRKTVRKFRKSLIYNVSCGEGGIRTPGGSHLNGFQDRRNRPLCHLSLQH